MITPESAPYQAYFPEGSLARWPALLGYPDTVLALSRVGVQPLRAAYRALIARYDIDAVVLVDGGTDILMRGDESGLGTPEEHMTSVAALEADGAYLGAFSVPRASREGALFVDAVTHARATTPDRPSIVNGCFAFELEGIARRCLYLDRIEHTHLIGRVSSEIEAFRDEVVRRRPPPASLTERIRSTHEVFPVVTGKDEL